MPHPKHALPPKASTGILNGQQNNRLAVSGFPCVQESRLIVALSGEFPCIVFKQGPSFGAEFVLPFSIKTSLAQCFPEWSLIDLVED